ncbi:hypothetical protein [Lentibacillus sp.]|uniref:hypothetical protein n=1 Tax=Lentibacillus sp. TaxID=1925746 RepID=UPI002B4B449E|nr:hypothetical protein [Lentibacillus sp.]
MIRSQVFYIIGLGLLIAIPLILALLLNNSSDQSNGNQNGQNGDNGQDIYWGVDSASYTDENMYQCVNDRCFNWIG